MKMTKMDLQKIQEELDYRKGAFGQELRHTLKVAREQGDLSENADYTAAKRANNQNNSRIAYLENIVRHAVIIEDTSEEGTVGLNKAVTVWIPEDEEEETYKIVTSIRGNSVDGRISTDSPMGKALMGHRVGDTVTVQVNPQYRYEVEIRKIEYIEDDGTDGIRQY